MMRAVAGSVAKMVVCGGKAWRRAEAVTDNHSPPASPVTRHALLTLNLAGHFVCNPPSDAAGKASERTKASACGTAYFAQFLAEQVPLIKRP